MNRHFGDFQTPPELVDQVLKVLGPIGKLWPRVLEPTCGTGNFVAGLLRQDSPPLEIHGFEIQYEHLLQARRNVGTLSNVMVDLRNADIFQTDLRRELTWHHAGPLLVLGNPPWVTNSELGSLQANNSPKKINLRKLRGIAAMTGESNFDLGEAVWIKLLTELEAEHPTIALLCKTSVARNVLRFAIERGIDVARAEIRRIDAKHWFGAAVDACLFIAQMGSRHEAVKVPVYRELHSTIPETILEEPALCDRASSRGDSAEGNSGTALTWRQGIKHDAASVMELTQDASGRWKNRAGIAVNVEAEAVFPLLKSSDLFNGRHTNPRRHVIITQRRIGEDTDRLQAAFPMLWEYLNSNREAFERRKSAVFKGRSDFAMFGIGEYSFAEYKIAVAGLYSAPRFRVVGPLFGKPVMLDDTCYFAPCQSSELAATIADVLNGETCLNFLKSLVLKGSKRPVTKSILQRIDIDELFKCSGNSHL